MREEIREGFIQTQIWSRGLTSRGSKFRYALGDSEDLLHELNSLKHELGCVESQEQRVQELQRALILADKAAQEWKTRKAIRSALSVLVLNFC